MVHVARLPMLKRVDFHSFKITPAMLRTLAEAKGLTQVVFDSSPVTDESLAEVGRMTGLTYLSSGTARTRSATRAWPRSPA